MKLSTVIDTSGDLWRINPNHIICLKPAVGDKKQTIPLLLVDGTEIFLTIHEATMLEYHLNK